MPGSHINAAGQFQSDKYDWAPPDFVPLKITDKAAQRALYDYAAAVDPQDCTAEHWEFVSDILVRLEAIGFKPPASPFEGMKPVDPDTPIGAAMARDHAIARFFNLAESMAREFESLTRDFAAAARQGFEDERRRREERRPGR
jgi:hypothetical protein